MPQGSFAARRQVYILVHEQLLHTLRSALVDPPPPPPTDVRYAVLGAAVELT
jgi:hypothetical protein